jgi:hypothetical protein
MNCKGRRAAAARHARNAGESRRFPRRSLRPPVATEPHHYSSLSAAMGSVRAARRAGSQLANSAAVDTPSVAAQRHGRIDPRRAPRRQGAGGHADAEHEQRRAADADGVGGAHAE